MKKSYIAIALIILAIVAAGVLFLSRTDKDDKQTMADKKTDKTQTDKQKPANDKPVDSKGDYAVDFELSNGKHLRIKNLDDENIALTILPSSVPQSVTIEFADTNQPSDKVSGILSVIPTADANARCERVTSTTGYDTLLREYIAITSSTQCAKLKPEDFKEKQIRDYTVQVGERKDYCTYGRTEPGDEEMHMYGFELGDYTVVLFVNGDSADMPSNADAMMETIIQNLSIE